MQLAACQNRRRIQRKEGTRKRKKADLRNTTVQYRIVPTVRYVTGYLAVDTDYLYVEPTWLV